jgi:hypothetical protein
MPPERAARRGGDSPILRLGELVVCVLVVGVPLAIGGVHPQVLVAIGLGGALALALVLVGRRGGGVPVPAAGLALFLGTLAALLTVLPLPARLVALLSPHAHELAAFAREPQPGWIRLSLDTPATWVDLPRLAGLAALLLAATALARRADAARRLTIAIAVAGIAMAGIAALHLAAGVTELYGFYPHHFDGELVTPFINGNHAASLALLAMLACVGLARTTLDVVRRTLWTVGAAACGWLAFMTHSNGGIAAVVVALGLYAALAARRSAGRVGLVVVVGLGLAAAVGVAALIGLGGDEFIASLRASGESKIHPWPATLRLIHESWLTGVGRGAFGAAFPPYALPRTIVTVTHPENIVLHWCAEWGVPLALAGFGALAVTLARAFRRGGDVDDAAGPIHDALLAATIGVLLHDFADFGLELGGVAVPFVVAVGVLAGRSAGELRWRRAPWLVVATALVTAVLAISRGRPHLADVELAALAPRLKTLDAAAIDREYRALQLEHPADPLIIIDGADALLARFANATLPQSERLAAMDLALRYLVRAQTLSQQEQPHLGLAWALARLGRRSQAFTELRLAYVTSTSLNAIDQALSYGATAEELASFPQALARAHPSSVLPTEGFSPAHVAAVMLGYVAGDKGLPGLADRAARQLMQLPAADGIPHEPELLETVCRIAQIDGECARDGRRSCSPKADASRVAASVVETGREWVTRDPTNARAYTCLARGYLLMHADEQARRVLLDVIERFLDALPPRLTLAEWSLQRQQPEEALSVLQSVAGDGDASVAPAVRSIRVRALWASGRHAAARAEAEGASRLYPDAFWAHRLAGGIHESNGQIAAALVDIANADRVAPENEKAGLAAWRARLTAAP